ncbi:MAG: DUF882 domain-containing protein [Candidatus Acidiferrales bacterium]
MVGVKTMSRNLVMAGAALALFASGALLPRMQAVASAQSGGAGTGSAQSQEVSASAGTAVGRQGLEHRLVLYNTHTAERIDIVYRHGEEYIPAALAKLDYFLRDHVTGDVRHFDPRLYDILSDLTASVGHPGGEIDIVCGYRTPTTNESLRAHTTGVAKHSLHIQAEAIDLRMPGINTLKLRAAAVALRRGGVGYYPHSDFIHVDTGRVRHWCFECPADLMSGD